MARIRAAALATLLVWLAVIAGAPAAWAQAFPKLTGRVVDAANIIPDAEEALLTQKLAALEQQSRRQLVVATIPSLEGYEISDYGYRLGRAWGIGQKDMNNGAILLVAPNERKVRIEVGYGLEGTLTDGLSFLIINNDILPRFKAGDMPGGIAAGTDALIKQLTLPPEEAQKIAAEADQAQRLRQNGDGVSVGHVIFIIFILLFFVLPVIRSAMGGGRKGRYGGINTPIIWFPGGFGDDDDDRGGWGGGGFGGGGFGGGGGFSGGGGSFGGGGASGSW